MDDIIIFSKIIEQHNKDLIVIINILLNANMKISIEKSKFIKLETTFLGYVVSHNVIKTDPEKVSTILKYPIPKNIRELRSFLGFTGYYRKFVSAVRAFNELKDNLIAQIELVQPDYNKKFTLTTDASDLAIGAVLSQEGKPITFISKTLNYAINKKEL